MDDHRIARSFAGLAAAVLLLAIADSMAGSFMVLFLVNRAHLTPSQVGVLVSAPAVSGILVSTVAGRRFDRRPTRSYVLGVTALGAVGYLLLNWTRSFLPLLLIAFFLLGVVAVAFPQLFALARITLGDGSAGQRSAPLLRSAWSSGWAIGPLASAALLPRIGFNGIFTLAGLLMAATGLITSLLPPLPDAPVPESALDRPEITTAPGISRIGLAALTLSVGLFFGAMIGGSVALPLYVTQIRHQPDALVGVLYSVCAAVEIVTALALVAVPARVSQRSLILGSMVVFAAYFGLTAIAHSQAGLIGAQAARGFGIAVVGAAGIRFFQEVMAPATGRATTLFSNASTAGVLVAGVAGGVCVQAFGPSATLLIFGVIVLIAAIVFRLAAPVPAPEPVSVPGP
jgi:SET family sugar efflux transporter-like MFS transporter